jgi:tetratricopeptide (TPR) repeat protein
MILMRRWNVGIATMALTWLAVACGAPTESGAASAVTPQPEATSLLGVPLFPPASADDVRERMEADLAEARATSDAAPGDANALIWVGRRAAYLGRYREAIATYTDGIARHPDDARFYRHRGHRYISVREFDKAIADLERAAALVAGQTDEVEPDGQPNALGIPTSTLHSNIYYHLGLARYLTGAWAPAADAWTLARRAVANPDNIVAASHWLYLSKRRAGHDDAASVLEGITADLDVIENGSYHSLLLLYKGEADSQALLADATAGASGSAVTYGVGAWLALEGREDEAVALWQRMVTQPDWPSFGHIAAEAELARRR